MASPFWQYFHDRLNWPAIFRPGPVSALVKGLALYMDDVREDILWLRRQWNPSTADDDMIAALRRNDPQGFAEAAQASAHYRPLAACALDYALAGVTSVSGSSPPDLLRLSDITAE